MICWVQGTLGVFSNQGNVPGQLFWMIGGAAKYEVGQLLKEFLEWSVQGLHLTTCWRNTKNPQSTGSALKRGFWNESPYPNRAGLAITWRFTRPLAFQVDALQRKDTPALFTTLSPQSTTVHGTWLLLSEWMNEPFLCYHTNEVITPHHLENKVLCLHMVDKNIPDLPSTYPSYRHNS